MTPTTHQLKLLRLLAAGAKLVAMPQLFGGAALTVNGVQVAKVTPSTVDTMRTAGWIAWAPATVDYRITDAGRDHANVSTFVKAFADANRASASPPPAGCRPIQYSLTN